MVASLGILAPWPGIEPSPPALEGEVLTDRPPRKSLILMFDFKKLSGFSHVWLFATLRTVTR